MTTTSEATPRGHEVLTFLGAAGTVTGSRFLIDTPRARVLVDCGLFQGRRELRRRNWGPFPVQPSSIDAVVITHAHVDHTGYLPVLCRDGFSGPVFATGGTVELSGIVLPDSGHLQEEEAAFANRMGYSKHQPARPLYTEEDALKSLRQFEVVHFGDTNDIAPGVHATLKPAGHILGSAVTSLNLEGSSTGTTVVFSGDLGRPHHPLLVPPAPPVGADVIVVESTHGGRRHADVDDAGALAEVIIRTAERGGTVVIPAFAVDRTEVILFHLQALIEANRIPSLPIYVDSPMALSALDVYRRAIARQAPDVRPELSGAPFSTRALHEARTVAESKALADLTGPAIIVSASGMATGGRVLHHLARCLPDHRNSVVMVGFQAEATRGRSLIDGATEVKMLGRHVRVRAEVLSLPEFSVHADEDELIDWLSEADREPHTVHIVHGEPDAAASVRAGIEARLDWLASCARDGERVLLG